MASAATKAALIVAVAASGILVAGATGSLPAPIQNAVSHAINSLTPIHLPTSPGHRHRGPEPPTTVPPATATTPGRSGAHPNGSGPTDTTPRAGAGTTPPRPTAPTGTAQPVAPTRPAVTTGRPGPTTALPVGGPDPPGTAAPSAPPTTSTAPTPVSATSMSPPSTARSAPAPTAPAPSAATRAAPNPITIF